MEGTETAQLINQFRSDVMHRYPFRLSPFFIIEHCRNCKDHQWCTRHDES